MAGMFLFWPSAVLLLLAAFAGPRRRPVAAKAIGGAGVVVTVAVLAGCPAYAWHFYAAPAKAESHTYRAGTDPGRFRAGLGDATSRLKQSGADDVTGSQSDDGSYLNVRFPDQLSEPERRNLKNEIAQLPGIIRVNLCPVSECG